MCTRVEHQHRRGAGFTYVEMVIVVCLIGLLAAAVILASHAVTNRARNARIVSSMRQIKVIANTVFEENNAAGYCTEVACAATDSRMDVFKEDINDLNGDDPSYGEPVLYAETTFCAEAKMRGGDRYCMDSEGNATGAWGNGGVGKCDSTSQPSAPFCI